MPEVRHPDRDKSAGSDPRTADIFTEEFNARLGRTFVCAGCGVARAPRLGP